MVKLQRAKDSSQWYSELTLHKSMKNKKNDEILGIEIGNAAPNGKRIVIDRKGDRLGESKSWSHMYWIRAIR